MYETGASFLSTTIFQEALKEFINSLIVTQKTSREKNEGTWDRRVIFHSSEKRGSLKDYQHAYFLSFVLSCKCQTQFASRALTTLSKRSPV